MKIPNTDAKKQSENNPFSAGGLRIKHTLLYASICIMIFVTLSGPYLHFAWNRHKNTASSEAIMLAQSLEAFMHPEHIAELSGGPEVLKNSPPGQVYEEANDIYWEPFRSGKTILTDKTTDRWGSWVSVLVPIKDQKNGNVESGEGAAGLMAYGALGGWRLITASYPNVYWGMCVCAYVIDAHIAIIQNLTSFEKGKFIKF